MQNGSIVGESANKLPYVTNFILIHFRSDVK